MTFIYDAATAAADLARTRTETKARAIRSYRTDLKANRSWALCAKTILETVKRFSTDVAQNSDGLNVTMSRIFHASDDTTENHNKVRSFLTLLGYDVGLHTDRAGTVTMNVSWANVAPAKE